MVKPRIRIRPGNPWVRMARADGWCLIIRASDFPSPQEAWPAAMIWFAGGPSPYPLDALAAA